MTLVPRVRAIAGSLDPTLRLSEFQRVDQVTSSRLWILGVWIRMTLGMTAVALLLSLAGIYAVMSFTVARRTREIGVRVALGARRRRVLTAIFRRPLTQVGLGVAAGAALIALGALGLSRTYQFQGLAERTLGRPGRAARGLRGVHAGGVPARLRRPDAARARVEPAWRAGGVADRLAAAAATSPRPRTAG
jgi:hypothetical protein